MAQSLNSTIVDKDQYYLYANKPFGVLVCIHYPTYGATDNYNSYWK